MSRLLALLIALACISAGVALLQHWWPLTGWDPIVSLRAIGEFIVRFAWIWMAIAAWILRGLWEREKRAIRFYDHTTSRRS